MRKDVHRNLSLWKYKWVLMKIYLCPYEKKRKLCGKASFTLAEISKKFILAKYEMRLLLGRYIGIRITGIRPNHLVT
jgi:hypothetical protein